MYKLNLYLTFLGFGFPNTNNTNIISIINTNINNINTNIYY